MANPTFIDSQHISRLNPEETLTTNGLGAAIGRNQIFHHEGSEEHEEKREKIQQQQFLPAIPARPIRTLIRLTFASSRLCVR